MDRIIGSMAGREVGAGKQTTSSVHDSILMVFFDSVAYTPGALNKAADGTVKQLGLTSGRKAMSTFLATALKPYNPQFKVCYAKVMDGAILGQIHAEIKDLFGDLLDMPNNPLLSGFTIIVHAAGNELRNPNNKSNIAYLAEMPPDIVADHEAYTKTLHAFPNFIHKGTGGSQCYGPSVSDTRRLEYDGMTTEIRRHLVGLKFVLSEVATRKHMIMRTGDGFRTPEVAKNTAVMVKHSKASISASHS